MKQALKGLLWLAGGTLALLVLAYGILLLINLHDEQPSDAALTLASALPQGPAPDDANNAYLYLAGLGAPAEGDPVAYGRAWLDWSLLPFRQRELTPEPELLQGHSLGEEVLDLLTPCKEASRACLTALEQQDAQLPSLVAPHQWLVDRYRTLLTRERWHEPPPTDYHVLFINYGLAMQVRRLAFISHWHQARAGNLDSGLMLAEQDARFWRLAMREARTLLSKMVATEALRQNLLWTNALLKAAPTYSGNRLPTVWHEPLTLQERSMLRAYAGELELGDRILEAALAGGLSYQGEAVEYASDLDMWLMRTLRPLIQPQACHNEVAGWFVALEDAYTQPYVSLPDAAEKQRALADERMTFRMQIYNPIAWRLTSGYAESEDYGLRVADIEGVRRALIVADSMRAAGVQASDVSAAIARHEITDPYTGEPLGWDPASLAVVPRRLAEGRGEDTQLPY